MLPFDTTTSHKQNPLQTGTPPLCLPVAVFVRMWKSARYICAEIQKYYTPKQHSAAKDHHCEQYTPSRTIKKDI